VVVSDVATGPGWELREGLYQERLVDTHADVLCWDPPYSPRVHDGQRTGSSTRKSTIVYDSISPEWCASAALFWSCRVHWAITFSDHSASKWWEDAWESVGWYVFAPVLWIRSNPTPRMAGDGPTSAADYITVARPRRRLLSERCGSRPGYYVTQNNPGSCLVAGGKQLEGIRQIIRDYSLPGDLIADGCSGGGTTLLAAVMEGRRAIGAECDPKHFEIARRRLESAVVTTPLFFDAPMKQAGFDL
jgi:hypothetical protein